MDPKSRLTEEEYNRRLAQIEKADAEFNHERRGAVQVEHALYDRLFDSIPLWHIAPLCHGFDDFEMYFFFETDKELEASKTNGKREEIERVAWEEVIRAGRSGPPQTVIKFVYDSNENVIENYEGDYQNRLR